MLKIVKMRRNMLCRCVIRKIWGPVMLILIWMFLLWNELRMPAVQTSLKYFNHNYVEIKCILQDRI
uniref:Uncharacterized protein n=1 Tax=Papilio xuthus TaxID=66420 RepID=I4DQR2_PAPXU|nr:unknown unsecreted protein [Papilio xuthus]